ncbi:hypothetical protein NUM3379_06380 [Kineococcus sp. NUM-3379]
MEEREAEAVHAAIRAVCLRHRARTAELLAATGLHPGQEVLLLELDEHGPRTQAQLAAAAGCEPPVVTVSARKLEAAGFLTREPSPTDRRATVVRLTDRGRAAARQVRGLRVRQAEEAVAGLAATTPQQLLAVLDDLARSLCGARQDTSHPPDPGGCAG